MRNLKTVISILIVYSLLSVVRPQAFPISWTFSGDTITINLNSGADGCTGTFTNGQMKGVASTGGTHACGGKMVSETQFSLIIVDLTFNPGGGVTGSFLGATGVETYGQAGSDTTNIIKPNAAGAAFASTYATQAGASVPAIFAALPPAESANSATMTVRIHNQVEKHWSSSLTSTGMTTWTLSGDLNQGFTRDLTIQFDSSVSSATATATFTSGSLEFKVIASNTNNAKDVKINWGTIHMENDHYLIPPSFAASTDQSIGFRPGGIYNIGIFRPSTLTNTNQGIKSSTDWTKTWMKDYAAFFNDKAMHNIIIPGTHDAGSTRFQLLLLDFYFRTQTESYGILAQLNGGVRCLDLRIFENSGQFLIMHNSQTVMIGGSTPLTLGAVLDDVLTFVKAAGNENEIIILDFHRFVIASGSFDYTSCKAIVTNHGLNTESRLILDTKSSMTYAQLISDSNTARVIAAWNDAGSRASPFWTGVDQKYAGDQVYLTTDMYTYFTNQFTAPQTALTAASDRINRPDGGPFFYFHDSTAYFSDPSRVSNLNIIQSDFIDKSFMVQTSISMNLVKVDAVAESTPTPSGAASLIASLVTTLALSFVLFF